jgi:hypothetical protein
MQERSCRVITSSQRWLSRGRQARRSPLSPGSIDAKKADFDGRIAVDYGLHVIMTKGFSYPDVAELGDVIRNGCRRSGP